MAGVRFCVNLAKRRHPWESSGAQETATAAPTRNSVARDVVRDGGVFEVVRDEKDTLWTSLLLVYSSLPTLVKVHNQNAGPANPDL